MRTFPLLVVTWLAATSCFGQSGRTSRDFYLFFAPGGLFTDGLITGVFEAGGGAEALLVAGLGIQAELGYAFSPPAGFTPGVGVFSPGLIYNFRADRSVAPFVDGGYSLAFRSGTLSLVHFGAGLNGWFSEHVGVRVELRDLIHPPDPDANILQLKVGVVFR